MSSKQPKLPTNFSIEELLNTLEKIPAHVETDDQSQFDEHYDYNDDILDFIQAFKINPGQTLIGSMLMYRIYKQWSLNPTTKLKFAKRFGDFIAREGENHYLISANIFNFTKLTKQLLNHKLKRQKRRIKPEYIQEILDYYGIKPGKMWLEGYIIHYLYIEWCDANRRAKKLAYNPFLAALRSFFEFKMTHTSLFFRVDESILQHLPQSKLDAMRKGKKRRHG